METTTTKNSAALIHISALSQYLFPLGNFIMPIVLWTSLREKAEYINIQGKRVINFQLSLLIYSIVLAMIAIPIFLVTVFQNVSLKTVVHNNHWNFNDFNFQHISGWIGVAIMAVIIFGMLKIAEFFLIIYGAVRAANGEDFKYPLSLPFLKESPRPDSSGHPFKQRSEVKDASE